MTTFQRALSGFFCIYWLFVSCKAFAESPAKPDAPPDRSTEDLVAKIGASIVTISSTDRDGKEHGLGTGFVIDASGLIATNFHVISEGRPLTVELWPSKALKVLAVEASNRRDDLAILRVATGKAKLKPLLLSDELMIAQGASVLAFGNPLGLRHSVVQGVVSAVREIEQREMIQVAIPIEHGNSGGPLVDMDGKVHGIINMKSSISKNIGFAIPIVRLKAMMQAMNPIAIDRWVRFASIDPNRWTVIHGGEWQERSGLISVTGKGNSFGGRTLCLNQQSAPEGSFEVAVDVKLEDESGAAGLVFQSDEGDRHFGFYPSNRKLRLTCFNGPNVLDWEIIKDVASSYYLLNNWNRLLVRVEGDRIQCFINGQSVIDEQHSGLSKGSVGMAAFRGTQAEFRRFRVSAQLEEEVLNSKNNEAILELAERSSDAKRMSEETIVAFASQSNVAAHALIHEAEKLGRRADGLKKLAEDVQLAPVLVQLKQWMESTPQHDLLVGGLLIAALVHPEIDIQSYVDRVDKMAEEVNLSLPENADDEQKLLRLNRYLFEENGFHGGVDEFYHQANNQLDRVIDDREGMPITLCILYMELGQRIGLSFEGVGLPGRFIVRYRSSSDTTKLIDVFEKGGVINETEVAMMVMMNSQRLPIDEDLRSQQPIEIMMRVLRNLYGSAEETRDIDAMRRYSEGLVTLLPDDAEYRWKRCLTRYQSNRLGTAVQDLDWLIERQPVSIDLDRLIQLRIQMEREMAEAAK